MVGNCVLIFCVFLPALHFHLQCYRLQCSSGVITKGVFSLEESLESLNSLDSLDSLESLENGRIRLYFPRPRAR